MTNNATFQIKNLASVKSWAFMEAQDLLKRLEKIGKAESETVVFETGYGPSGLPHIGTFAEVLRTSMVRQAFEVISGRQTRLIAFSDDMDGLRKVPDNVPNRDMLQLHLNKPLTAVPNPFTDGAEKSFAAHNNKMLQGFLDRFGFDYEFTSATECYQAGRFDDGLLNVLNHYDEVLQVMLKSLGDERQQTYSPFLPICPDTGKVLQAKVVSVDAKNGTIIYINEQGKECETLVTGGKCKLQWKPDWAMRWHVLGIDYEMAGKDLSESVKLSSRITRIMGAEPPVGFSYELFLDDKGEKISKSKGNGLSMEEWLNYAPEESLAWFMYHKPKTAKRLYFDVIPKQVDEYLDACVKYEALEEDARFDSPLWHMGVMKTNEHPMMPEGLSFAMLQNLTSVCNSEDKSVIWGFISNYASDANPETMPYLDRLIGYAIQYYQDFVKPYKNYITPEGKDRDALESLLQKLRDTDLVDANSLQNIVFAVGKEYEYEPLRDWFKFLYQSLLGQTQGPRMGSFFMIYGYEKSCKLIESALTGALQK